MTLERTYIFIFYGSCALLSADGDGQWCKIAV